MRGAPLCDPGPLADTVPPFPCLYTESSPPRPGSRLTRQDLASFRPEVVDALAMPLGDYTLYSPPPPAGGAILSFVLTVLKGEAPPRRSPGLRVGPGERCAPEQTWGRLGLCRGACRHLPAEPLTPTPGNPTRGRGAGGELPVECVHLGLRPRLQQPAGWGGGALAGAPAVSRAGTVGC